MKYAYVTREVPIPADKKVSAKVTGKVVEIKGPKGSLTRDFAHAKNISITMPSADKIVLESRFPKKQELATIGTLEGHIKNLILGVTEGYKFKMKIVYAHFPITVKVNNNILEIQNFIGERGNRTVKIANDVKVSATKEDVIVEGIDKEKVGQMAATIQLRCKIRNKDRRIFEDGIYCYEKWSGSTLLWHIKQ
jgi:large subunit ribosomal protein L6